MQCPWEGRLGVDRTPQNAGYVAGHREVLERRPVGQQHRLAQGLLEMQILRPSALPTQNL